MVLRGVLRVALCVLGLAVHAETAVSPASPAPVTLTFDVLLNERPIGRHTFELAEIDTELGVTSRVEMSVRLMFVEVFAYRHQAIERWRGNCLLEMQSSTRQNGRDESVEARATAAGFVIEASNDAYPAVSDDDCIGSYAYWDLDRLRRDRLLNAQKGVLDPVELVEVGVVELPWRPVPVRSFELTTNDAVITLWYDKADQWMGLKTRRDGRWLEYRRVDSGR